jgi:WD40 repeat protein
VQSASFSPDGKLFVSCGNWPEGDKTLRIWDVGQGTEILKIEHPGQAAIALFSPDGQQIASASGDGNAYLWNAKTGERVRVFKGHTAGINGVAFNHNGSRIITSGSDKTARIWDAASGKQLQSFTGHTEMIRRVAFHPDGKHAISAGRDAFVRMWEMESAREVKRFQSSGKRADCLAVSKDGKYLATGGTTLRVFEIATGRMLSEGVGHQFGLTHAAFSNDGQRLLTASYDGSARLWDRDTGKELYRFPGHREYLWCAAFSPDNRWIITAGGGRNAGGGRYEKGTDFGMRLWRMPDEKMMAELAQDQNLPERVAAR